MDVALVERLGTGEGRRLLEALPPYRPSEVLSLQQRLRAAGFDADLVAAALTQARLRARAADKFGRFAGEMLFTPDGLEQATRLDVAARHAERYRSAGIRHVHDLGCGIGSDAMALAGLDVAVTAVDTDPVTAAVAGHNLRHWEHAGVVVGPAEHVDLTHLERDAGVWLDPSRRRPGPRTLDGRAVRVGAPEATSPPWSFVLQTARTVAATGAKVAPGVSWAAIPPGTEAQWTSWRGDLVECAIWWGPLARTEGRTAAVCRPDAPTCVVTAPPGDDETPPTAAGHVDRYLYDPDPAVRAAGLTGVLAALADGRELTSGVGYLTSDRVVDVPWARRYAVRDAFAYHPTRLRGWLRAQRVGTLVVKTRGVPLDADRVRREARLRGDGEATILLAPVAGRTWVLALGAESPSKAASPTDG